MQSMKSLSSTTEILSSEKKPPALKFANPTFPVSGFLTNEIHHGDNPVFTKWKEYGSRVSEQFEKEMKAYARGQYPFNTDFASEGGGSTEEVIVWWEGRISGHAQLLPYIAIKLFSTRINSMADERTASTLTWMSPATRSRLSVEARAARAIKPSRPWTKFCHIKKDFTKSNFTPEEEDDGWLDNFNEDQEDQGDAVTSISSKIPRSFLHASNAVNPNAFEIVSLLSDSAMDKTAEKPADIVAESVPGGEKDVEFKLWFT
ncbi:hypothetical protein K435DRAFT_803553 [Dendrothele bispora CBS 962.96]|uniref:HAT C-terminal dimerisation domain-containing protein n=1 Tax=Dendrothele bispora (strain CBS 962.96) TaxID=1314807 RepID=A0A4S8LH71_DENBC|nr:hypothetical protein K435DRAFT_803553 [Dendrothele bispora CBS 962.96]